MNPQERNQIMNAGSQPNQGGNQGETPTRGSVAGDELNSHRTPDYPIFSQFGRTGATRYTPRLQGDKYDRVFIYYPDAISIQEYDEMRYDGQIRAGSMLIKLPIQRARWTINCEDKDISSFVSEVLRPIWPQMIRHILMGLDFGYTAFEKIWTLTYGFKVTQNQAQAAAKQERTYPVAVTLQRLMQLDPLMIYLLAYQKSGKFAGIEQFTPEKTVIPASKSFLFTHDQEFDELYGISRLRPCYPYWYYKKLMYEWTGVYFETYSIPMKKGRYPEGRIEVGMGSDGNPAYEQCADHMINLLEDLRNNHVIALPAGRYEDNGEYKWDVELLETGRSSGDHVAYIDHLNLMILKSLLVPQLALETGSSGTYDLAQEQIDFFMLGEEALMDQIAFALNKDLVPQIVKYNFGKSAPRAELVFQAMYKDIMEGLANVLIETLGQGQPVPLKDGNYLMPDWQWVAETSGIAVDILTEEDLQAYRTAQQANFDSDPQTQAMMEQGVDQEGNPMGVAQGGQGNQLSQNGAAQNGKAQVQLAEESGEWVLAEGELVWRTMTHA